jgi:hypothetical protein
MTGDEVAMTGTGAPPGWYPDPAGSNGQRYWDGTTWTGHLSPTPPPSSVVRGRRWRRGLAIVLFLLGVWLGINAVATIIDPAVPGHLEPVLGLLLLSLSVGIVLGGRKLWRKAAGR